MKRTKISTKEIFENIGGIKWGLLYYSDEIRLENMEVLTDKDINNSKLLEGHLFGPKKEIHIFDYDGKQIAVMTEDEENDTVISRKYEISGVGKKGKVLVSKEYVSYDNDSMAFIEYVRPLDVI